MSIMDSIAQFHFLRPLWLFALLVVPLIMWFAHNKQALSGSDWRKAIQPALLAHLKVGNQTTHSHRHTYWFALVAILLISGLAGPSWEKKPQPIHQPSDNLAIVLDLSLSMLASDQKPDRLTRAKHKLRDLLAVRKEGNTALIVYSGDSHVVTPLTDDTNTLRSMLPALDPFIMPAMGSRPTQAIAQAIEVLQNGGGNKGRILLITDGVEEKDLTPINELLRATNYPLSVLAIGTEQGGPISIPERGYLKDKGSVIIPKTDFDVLNQLAEQNNGVMEPIELSDSDLKSLGAINAADVEFTKTSGEHNTGSDDYSNHNDSTDDNGLFDQWHDEGYWFALLLIPVVLMGYRRGAFSLVLLLSLSLSSNETMALEWKDLWKTKDQQAMEVVNQDPAKAAELFEDPQWKASAHYQAQNFEAAQASFASNPSAQSLYNQANALAQQQKFEEAIAAYDKALEADPNLDDAQFNKALIEKFLEDQQSQDQQSKDQQSDSQDSQDNQQSQDSSSDAENSDSQDSQSQDSQSQDSQQQDAQPDESESQQSDSQNEQSQEQQSQAQQANEQQPHDQQTQEQEQQAQAHEAEELTDEETQAFEQWMRRVPDDPGGLLRRKFSQQYQQRGQQRQEGQPIW